MRFLIGIVIILVTTGVGAGIPFLFKDKLGSAIGVSSTCDMLATGTKLGHLDAARRAAIIDAVAKSADVDDRSKALIARVSSECP